MERGSPRQEEELTAAGIGRSPASDRCGPAAAAWLLLPGCSVASASRSVPQRSDGGRRLPRHPAAALSDTERIEVVYFFYYGCQWCYQFEPLVADWLKQKPVDVSFRRSRLCATRSGSRSRAPTTRTSAGSAPAAARARPSAPSIATTSTCRARAPCSTGSQSRASTASASKRCFSSDAVTARMTDSRALTDAFEVDSTPSVAVDGRYLTSSGMTGGVAQLMSGGGRADRDGARGAAAARSDRRGW